MGFNADEAQELAGPVENGLRMGGYLKEIEVALNDLAEGLPPDHEARKAIPGLIDRLTRARWEMDEGRSQDAGTVLAKLEPAADFGIAPPAGHFALRAIMLCRKVVERDKGVGSR